MYYNQIPHCLICLKKSPSRSTLIMRVARSRPLVAISVMAKLKKDPITQADLIEFLESESDFAFELSILRSLQSEGFECEHAGSYDDPYTEKPRQFDIRATKRFGKGIIRLAVECKNVGMNFPVLISCVPRSELESFHEVAFSLDPVLRSTSGKGFNIPALMPKAKSFRIQGEHSIYKPNQPVGKSVAQIGRARDNSIEHSDSDIYSKWSQAISSAQDLADMSYADAEGSIQEGELFFLSFVLPLVVVPDETLWAAAFDHTGARISAPHKVERRSFFLNRHLLAGGKLSGMHYHISHLEFVTRSGLQKLIREFSSGDEALQAIFPDEEILGRVKSEFDME